MSEWVFCPSYNIWYHNSQSCPLCDFEKVLNKWLGEVSSAQHGMHLTGLTPRQKEEVEQIVFRLAGKADKESPERRDHPTLLEERTIEVSCPHCSEKFHVGLPDSQSG